MKRRTRLAPSASLFRRATTKEIVNAYGFVLSELSASDGWIGDEPAFLALAARLEEELRKRGRPGARAIAGTCASFASHRKEALSKCDRVMRERTLARDGGKS